MVMATRRFFSVRDIFYRQVCDGFIITAYTDVPCHLYMRYTTVKPRIHDIPAYRRGIFLHGDRYFCFTYVYDNEQEEAGDTLVHTFIKRGWPVGETRWSYFTGTQEGEYCVSTTAIWHLTFNIAITLDYSSLSNRAIHATAPTWQQVIEAASGNILTNYPAPFYRIVAGTEHTATLHNYRGFMFFDTSGIPAAANIVEAKVSLWIRTQSKTSSAAHPYMYLTQGVQQDPVIGTDYGAQWPYPTVIGRKHLNDMPPDKWTTINIDTPYLSYIVKGGITRFCLRGEMDVDAIYPPLGTNWVHYASAQSVDGKNAFLTVCYVPL